VIPDNRRTLPSDNQAGALKPEQVARAQGKIAGLVENTLADKWSGKLTSYQSNSLNFLSEQASRKSPLSEKQANWMGKLAREAATHNPNLGKSYLSEKVLTQIGL
jgi:hypothetical protein